MEEAEETDSQRRNEANGDVRRRLRVVPRYARWGGQEPRADKPGPHSARLVCAGLLPTPTPAAGRRTTLGLLRSSSLPSFLRCEPVNFVPSVSQLSLISSI